MRKRPLSLALSPPLTLARAALRAAPAMPQMSRRRLLRGLLALSGLALPLPAEARPAQFRLLLVEQRGCAGCASWLREIGPHYGQTLPEVPLTRVDIHAGNWPEGIVIGARPHATPTFLLLRDGVEIARFLGYAGEKRFWPPLNAALRAARM